LKKQLLLLVVSIISIGMQAQTCQCPAKPKPKTRTSTSTKVSVSVSTTFRTPKQSLSATEQAFFDEIELSGQEFLADRAADRQIRERTAFLKPAMDKVSDMVLLKAMNNPTTTLPSTIYDLPVAEQPVIVLYSTVVMPVVVKQARTSTSTTVYTDKNGFQKTATTTTRRY
jgi:hypothetical protein